MSKLKILLIGNSYTYYNGYGQILSKLCGLSSQSAIVVRATKGGASAPELLKAVLSYRAWENGKSFASGNAELSKILKMPFNISDRAGTWDYIVLQNNDTVKSTKQHDIDAFKYVKGYIPSPSHFIINCTYFGNSTNAKRLEQHKLAQEACKCSLIDERGIYAKYSTVFKDQKWIDDLTISDKPNYHASARGMYVNALCTYAKLFGVSKYSKDGKVVGIPLYNADGKTAQSFITDHWHSGTARGNSVTKSVAAKCQNLVYTYKKYIGNTLQTTKQTTNSSGGNTVTQRKDLGVDLSKYNTKVDYPTLSSSVKYTILRVGYRGYETGKLNADTLFTKHMAGCIENKIPVGVYFYSQAITTAEGKAEAEYVINALKKYKINLPIYIDVEYAYDAKGKVTGRLYKAKLSKRALTDICKAFCKTIKAAGYRAGVYANTDFCLNKLYVKEIAADGDSLWVADYRGAKPSKYIQGVTIDIWQNSENGKVKGITGKVDTDYMYTDLIKKDGTIQPAKPTPAPAKPSTPATKVTYFPKYTGKNVSIVDALKSLHYDNSFAYRKKIAKANGIKAYVGTASQNKKILSLLKSGKLIKP